MLPIGECDLNASGTREQSLAVAFASFTEAAGSLEKSYANLQGEVFRLRSQLEEAHQQLTQEKANTRRVQALAEVATLLAHEIRNPLGSLELFAGLLAESQSIGEDDRKLVGQVQAGLRTLAATVNNVLQFHSVSNIELIPISVANLVAITMGFLKPVAEQSAIRLEFENHLAGVHIDADPHRLQQVILNLAMNAIKFMPNGGCFRISGELAKDGMVELRVTDSGPGIAPEQREKIFAPGFTTRPGSPGLGLSVCKKIVEQHGGSIEIGDAQKGAEFVLRFKAL